MADGLFNVIEKLLGKLGPMVVESWNMRDDLEKLMDTMAEIKAVILDAEEQQSTNHQVQLWLEKLKDAVDDADNLLDEVSTEDLRQEVMSRDHDAGEVCICFPFFNQFVFSFKMAQKVKELRKRIESLNIGKKSFNLTNRAPERRVLKQRETDHSFIREEEVIGREEEKKELVELLLNVKEKVSIISIIGIGGLGKTALAKLLYNDKAVQQHFFGLKKWVCVSDDFDVKAIAGEIIGSKSDDAMEKVQQELRKRVEGKRYLLVLDDIWNEDREHWLKLMTLLKDGAKGSKIIITTRSEKVAKISGTSSFFFLKGLDEKQSWKLFSQLAFKNAKELENQNLVSIGKEIMKKCSGVPLAIQCIGNLMYSMETENDWSNFRDKDLLKIDEQSGNKVFQLLKLSYDHLPFPLKKCFSFCSLFPKDHEINRPKLIQLWVAQGFIDSSDESRCLEDVGNEYFVNLAQRSFFQDLRRNFLGDVSSCKMHDLVHDLAKFVSGNDFAIVDEKRQHIDKRTCHLSLGFPLDSSWQVPSSFFKAYKLRTFLLLPSSEHVGNSAGLEESTCNLIVSSFEQLRVLDLHNLNLRMISSCIGMLKHVRYLDLSHNKQLEVLPRSITNLVNLQTLLLDGCSMLRELPRDLWKLISLRHLDLGDCHKLSFMPRGIGLLTNLQTLTLFVLDRTSKHGGSANELGRLNNLRVYLEIKGLECLRCNPTEAKDINLMGKPHLQLLKLTWERQIDAEDNDMEKDNIILQGLLLHHNIKRLIINGFGGVTISGSINPFTNLVSLTFKDCSRLQYLPQLHLLLHLEYLWLENLPCLEWIVNDNSNDGCSTFFPSLKINVFENLINLKGWCRCSEERTLRGCHQFKNPLEYLYIWSCPNLISIPPHMDIEYAELRNVSEKMLLQAVNHSKVDTLVIIEINGLKSLSGVLQHLTTLRELSIKECEELDLCNDEDGCYSMQWKQLQSLNQIEFHSIPKMESLPKGLQHITTLQRLAIEDCANLTYIPEWITLLQAIKIKNCPNLTSLPEELGSGGLI